MPVLSDVGIEKFLRKGSLVLVPFDPDCLNGAGYDLRIATNATFQPGEHRLVATLETVQLGDDLAGTAYIRSSFARSGIIASLALIDPGFRGQLTISLYNAGAKVVRLKKGERFLQLVLHRLSSKSRRPYSGRYQNSQGVVDRRGRTP